MRWNSECPHLAQEGEEKEEEEEAERRRWWWVCLNANSVFHSGIPRDRVEQNPKPN